jgi:hypothetical protein
VENLASPPGLPVKYVFIPRNLIIWPGLRESINVKAMSVKSGLMPKNKGRIGPLSQKKPKI